MLRHIKGKIIGFKNCKNGPEMAQELRVNNATADAPNLVLSSHFWLLTTTHKSSSQGDLIPLVSMGTALTCTYPHTYTQPFFFLKAYRHEVSNVKL